MPHWRIIVAISLAQMCSLLDISFPHLPIPCVPSTTEVMFMRRRRRCRRCEVRPLRSVDPRPATVVLLTVLALLMLVVLVLLASI